MADFALNNIDITDEVGNEFAAWRFIDFCGCRNLHDLSLVQHRNTIGHGHRLLLIVGHDQKGQAEIHLQIHQLELGFFTQFFIQRTQRLIQQQHFRALGNRARQSHTLALTTGKLMRLALGEFFQLHQLQHIIHTIGHFRLGHAILLQAESNILLNGHMRKQSIGLEHHIHRTLIGRNTTQILPVQHDTAGSRLFKTCQHTHQSRFTATGSPEQSKKFAIKNIQRQIINHCHIIKLFDDILEGNIGFGGRIVPWCELTAKTTKRFHAVPSYCGAYRSRS